jgi:hypothetical protein
MAKITYSDKSKTGSGDTRLWRDVDANEVKASVNYLYDLKAVFAYLSEAATTTIAESGTFQFINGAFSNPVISGFSVVADPDPMIVCECEDSIYYEIDWHASVQANLNNTTVRVGIFKNGVLIAGSAMPIFCKSLGEPYSFSGTCVVELTDGDEIQLVVTSDGTGDEITFNAFTTTIRSFLITT